MKAEFRETTREELLQRSKIPITVLDTEDDIYHEIAREMFDTILACNKQGKPAVLIVPVGPVFQYRRFVRLAHRYRLDCSRVHLINMDEYMLNEKQLLPESHPLSFRALMDRELYSKLEGVSHIPEANRHFPMPGRDGDIQKRIDELGGVDLTIGGMGICGHIAFNEPPEDGEEMTAAQFARLPTRVLRLTRETLTINAVTAMGGYIDGIPEWCVTVGMREILSSGRVRVYLNREWQKGIIRKVCLGPVTPKAPCSLLQEHKDARFVAASYVMEPPFGRLR